VPKTILFIDGENFLFKVKKIISDYSKARKIYKIDNLDLNKLFSKTIKEYKVKRKIFYLARLHIHPETKNKSIELIKFQRKLRNILVRQGYEIIIAGNVRAQKIGKKVIFREKGVDVKIAVDMVSLSCSKQLATAILCSSDSDLQPAIYELKGKGVKVVYMGFENQPNRGMIYTSNKTVLIKKDEVVAACIKPTE
jgi:uncharacterized LabA/DUF88 family protein